MLGKKPTINKEFLKFSQNIGNNLDLVQGAGGNTSFKDGEILWVKASGCWLRDALRREIFIPLIQKHSKDEMFNTSDFLVAKNFQLDNSVESLRPSIETFLHLLMPHKYVVHLHSVNIISNSILVDGEQRLSNLLDGINWRWVNYERPGAPLAFSVQQMIDSDPDVLILANHGVIFGAESVEKASQLLNEIENRVKRETRSYKFDINFNNIESLVSNSDYCLSKDQTINSLAFDKTACSIASRGTLYPDHVVFLGAGPMTVLNIKEFTNYLNGDYDGREDDKKNVLIVRNLGVFMLKSLGEIEKSMLHCLSNVLLRTQPCDELRYLSAKEEKDLIDWDAEKYRKSIQR
jgi:rhamnose utilization protein RhaD (predicted bifunctional aldolase and dehydrogenase)